MLLKDLIKEEVEKTSAPEQIEKMIDQYQNLVLSICYKMTQDYFAAQDLTQETFLSAYQHLEDFSGENEKAWICRIATNKSIDYLRQAGRRQIPTEDSDMENYQSKTGRPEQETLETAVSEELKARCKQLKPPYDEIAYAYFYKEKPPEEIAREQNKNVKTIQTQIYRARGMLRTMYAKEHETMIAHRQVRQKEPIHKVGKEKCHEE